MGKGNAGAIRFTGTNSTTLDNLRPREREIIRLLSETSLCPKEIAGLLGISVRTVEKHIANAYQQLGIHSRSELMVREKTRTARKGRGGNR